jgi:holo-[acyl-carrier protein] synthase
MIFGVGIDIIEVERVAEKISRENGFREKIFSKNEIEFCESKDLNKAQHYAARFSAKEAFLKATGMGLLLSYELNEIEVAMTDEGKPEIQLRGSMATIIHQKGWKIHVSLSHIQTNACAIVVIETIEPTPHDPRH